MTERPEVFFHADRDVGPSVIYQRYYQQALEHVADVHWLGGPLRARVAHTSSRKIDVIAATGRPGRLFARIHRPASPGDSGHVARYELRDGASTRRFAIDARDNHTVDDAGALEWSDVYFKANRWAGEVYPPHVAPIVNGNGLITPARIRRLRALRIEPKEVDVVFISNVWGGREHNVRIFEELAGLGLRTDLSAVLPEGAAADDDAAITRRLAAVGVPATTSQVPLHELWRRLARARVIVIRSGRHLCIPWRMIDLLAMGACILFDAQPLPQWPEPLVEGVHYASMGIDRPAWAAPHPGEYVKVGPAVEGLLADEDVRHGLAVAAADYFDRHAAPDAVGRYLFDAIRTGAPAILASR